MNSRSMIETLDISFFFSLIYLINLLALKFKLKTFGLNLKFLSLKFRSRQRLRCRRRAYRSRFPIEFFSSRHAAVITINLAAKRRIIRSATYVVTSPTTITGWLDWSKPRSSSWIFDLNNSAVKRATGP